MRDACQARPSVFLGSLLDLNNGITHGGWFDATQPVESMLAAIGSMLERSPTTARTGEPADEWIVLDSEGFSKRIDPHEALEQIAVLATLAAGPTV